MEEFFEDLGRLDSDFDAIVQLDPLQNSKSLLAQTPEEREKLLRTQIHGTLFLMQALHRRLQSPPDRPLRFLSATLRGGHFGLSPSAPFSEIQGGIVGLVRTLALEVPEISSRVVDFDGEWNRNAMAQALLNELLSDSAPVEVGYKDGQRWTQIAMKQPLTEPLTESAALDSKDVILVSGGARGVTPHLLEKLAAAVPATYLLIGRSTHKIPPEVAAVPEVLDIEDPGKLKSRLFQELSARGDAPTPRELQNLAWKIQSYLEIEKNLVRLRATGATIDYLSLDITDASSVESGLAAVQSKYGSITGLIHAAGVLHDGRIETKSQAELDSVLAPKLMGLLSILDTEVSKSLRFVCLFSSVAGRFGNPGQADYAAANQILSHLAISRGGNDSSCRWIALDWGALDGGMVTEEIARAFRARGIELLPLEDAANAFCNELLGIPTQQHEIILAPSSSPTLGVEDRFEIFPVEWDQKISIHDHFYLKDHVLAEPVLPMSMGLDLMVHAALRVFPSLHFQALHNLKVFQKISFEKEEQTLRFRITPQEAQENLRAIVEILVKGDPEGRPRYRGIVEMGTQSMKPPTLKVPEELGTKELGLSMDELYDRYLFHGKSLRCLKEIRGHSEFGIEALIETSRPEDLIQSPGICSWNCDPRVLDGMAQMGLIWLGAHQGCIGIPQGLGKYTQYAPFPDDPVRCYVQIAEIATQKSIALMDFWIFSKDSQVLAHGQGWEAVFHENLNSYTTRGKRMTQ